MQTTLCARAMKQGDLKPLPGDLVPKLDAEDRASLKDTYMMGLGRRRAMAAPTAPSSA